MATGFDTSMTIKTNRDIKLRAQQIFSELGIDLTTAVNVFLRQAVNYNGFPFDVRLDVPNDETEEAIKEIWEMKKNPQLGKSYTDVDEMMRELLA